VTSPGVRQIRARMRGGGDRAKALLEHLERHGERYAGTRVGPWCVACAPVVAGVVPVEERMRIAVMPALFALAFELPLALM
jgi:hypothetical protein